MSTLVTNTITGLSTAANITIGSTPVVSASATSLTIRGEGSAQTSVQQGLAKAWANLKGTDTFGLRDSFNVSSATDDGAGTHTITINNDMSNNDYSVTASQGGNTANNDVRMPTDGGDFATGSYGYNTLLVGNSINDSVHSCTQVAGDLA